MRKTYKKQRAVARTNAVQEEEEYSRQIRRISISRLPNFKKKRAILTHLGLRRVRRVGVGVGQHNEALLLEVAHNVKVRRQHELKRLVDLLRRQKRAPVGGVRGGTLCTIQRRGQVRAEVGAGQRQTR